ncbi:MAG TPA: LytTR family DNA-binding domain-containing protein [Caulobacteraceae bacterium]|nr:LytTR family DNA-binding domain-containing protein [Caulobacteraceae bacterium]
MTNGTAAGTNGKRFPARAWLAVSGLVTLSGFVNVMTGLDDARRRGVAMPLRLPLTLEITSAVAALAAATFILAAVRLAPPGRGPIWRTVAIHLGGSLVYSSLHVGLMTLLRSVLWAAAGGRYPWALGELPYEYRKDVLAYVVIAGIFWIATRPAAAPAAAPATPAPATFDIRDANTLLRVPVREILAVRAARNYVEFVLEDGRRPLMRASIAQIETALAPARFLRTHRSWLVNAERVRALSATGSGDFRVDLGCGLTAPLSRRYPAALARVKGERSAGAG